MSGRNFIIDETDVSSDKVDIMKDKLIGFYKNH